MSYVVVHCGHCGCLFKSRKYVVRHPGIILAGNLEGCPTCGQMAEVLDGVFDAAMTIIKLIDGPHMTRDLLEKFADLIAQTQRGQITFDNLEHEAAKLNAKFGEAVASVRVDGIAFWTGVLLLAALALQLRLDAQLDLNSAFAQALVMYRETTASPPAKQATGEE